MRYSQITERMANERIHRNTSVATLKALARNASSHYARFVVADGALHAADAEAFTHHQIWSARATLRGWVHYLGDDRYSYKATGIYDMLPADDPVLRHLEQAGIKRVADLTEARRYPMAATEEWYGNLDYKARGGRLIWMTPDEYIAQVRPLDVDEISRDNIDDLKRHIASGRTLDPLAIYADGKEDGRHRAYAAKELGITRVPVLDFRSA